MLNSQIKRISLIFDKNEYEELTFVNIKISSLEKIDFDNCIFKNCSFNKAILKYCKFVECQFDNCDMSLIDLQYCNFNDVDFNKSKCVGINWSLCESSFVVNFYECNLSMSSFHNLNLKHNKIISCNANEVDFEESILENVDFKHTDLLNAVFSNTNLKQTDLNFAINYTIDPNSNYIKQTKVSLPEAVSFLNFLDLKIAK